MKNYTDVYEVKLGEKYYLLTEGAYHTLIGREVINNKKYISDKKEPRKLYNSQTIDELL